MSKFETFRFEEKKKIINRRTAVFAGAIVLLASGCSGSKEAKSSEPSNTNQTTTHIELGTTNSETDSTSGEFETEPSWEQDFSNMPDGPVDESVWTPELNPAVPTWNKEKQAYTSSTKNVRVEGGALVIEAHKEKYTYPNDKKGKRYNYTSGRIDTRNSLNFEYGKVEAEVQPPGGKGAWPAFWMLSANQVNTAKLDPEKINWDKDYLLDGEIDIFEGYGRYHGLIEGTVHTYNDSYEGHIEINNYDSSYHKYGIEFTPDEIRWQVDDKTYFTFKKPSDDIKDWPFQGGNEMYVILNLAMGGTGGGKIDPAINSQRMLIRSVRFYEYTGDK